MIDTNFYLAPLAKTVDGLMAVPIDIQRITASLTFDGATQTGSGDATLEFTMGPQYGNPIFDLRQNITAAWLDGASLPVTKLAHHDFGGGPYAGLRIIEVLLVAGSTHTLRVTYTLGAPQASTAGSYQPSISWSSGPRLTFNFGFTDLGAGRYLEAWVPANLIFDQFELLLELRILNTKVDHTVITNGEVTTLGANQWRLSFPARFTALSPLLELRASDTLVSSSDTVVLPVSGTNLTVEAWKLASNPIALSIQVDNLKNYLVSNENSTGPYMHGNRFIAFINVGGMEYEGGTTSSTGALQHETFHSWWARGIKPASQPDAWVDEAWTMFYDNGASEEQPFNYIDPPITLCSRNSWVRVTAGNAYSGGYRFWTGVAALVGVNTLKTLMSDFYKQWSSRPFTTMNIEEFLICCTGNTQLVDTFHRFVYGFDNPTSAPDLWLRDDPDHTGTDPWSGRFWDSPELWVRNSDDEGTTHQQPEFGQDNWFYARVHNHGNESVSHFVVTFNIKFTETEFLYPNDFLPCIAAISGFDLKPSTSAIVKCKWPRSLVPPPDVHACLLATVLARGDQPITSHHVWGSNNLAHKNLIHCETGSNLKIIDLWSQQAELPVSNWQQVEYGQDNWFYARVRNDGNVTAREGVVTFSFQCPYFTPVYPQDWHNKIISAAVLYDIAPGVTVTVKALFPKEMIPPLPANTDILHGCILAEVYNPVDHVPAGCTNQSGGQGKLFQRNTDVVDASPGDTLDYQLVISNYHIQHEQLVQLEVVRPENWEKSEIWFGHQNSLEIESLWEKAGKLENLAVQPVEEIIRSGPEIQILEPTRIMLSAIGDVSSLMLNLARGSTLMVPKVEAAERLRRSVESAKLFRRGVELVKEEGQTRMKLLPGREAGFTYTMQPRERNTINVHFKVPTEAKPSDQLKYEVVQRNDKGEVIGGFDVLVNVVAK